MNDVCAVQPAAQPDFNDGCIHFFIGKITEGHGGGQLEERRVQRLEKVTLFFYETYYILFRYRLSVYTDTFAEVHQVGGSVKSHTIPGFLQYGGQRVRTGTFAVGSRHMDGAERAVGMSEMFVQYTCVFQPFFVCRATHLLEHGYAVI